METLTCPSCGALCDPDTHRCLNCDVVHTSFTGGVLNFENRREPQWFTFPVIDNLGRKRTLSLYGTVNYHNKLRQLIFAAQKPPQREGVFLTANDALEN